ncbi:hypothetical protein ACHAXT_010978 [Thalassiosira profunda]
MKIPSLLALALAGSAAAFAPASPVAGFATRDGGATVENARFSGARIVHPAPPVALGASSGAAAAGLAGRVLQPILRRPANVFLAFLAAAATYLLSRRNAMQSLLWPGAQPDVAYPDNPLPEGSMGCPFLGHPGLFAGAKDYGPFAGFGKISQKWGSVFRTYSLGMPVVSVSGVDSIKSVLKNYEFRPDGVNTYLMGEKNLGEVMGNEGILYEADNDKHNMLRRLVGNAMTPAALEAALPSIQEVADRQVDKILEAETVQMESVFDDFTLDIAWKQILGLDLTEEEIPEFHRNVHVWTSKLMYVMLLLPFRIPGLMTLTKVGRARAYLVSKVEEKLARLDRDGPDSSTLSKLYFATDDDGTTKLTRTQVIHNALLLIIAGSETSASTLTVISLLLGLHPDVWEKIKEEQRELCSEYGEELTPKTLEKCTYLDAVIKEAMRIKPLEAQEARLVGETFVLDEQQIPKGCTVLLNIKQTHINDPAVYKEDGSHMSIKTGFKPERWLDESTKPMAWLPFGDGKRRCIGERLAMMEMKVFLSTLARKVDRFTLVNDTDEMEWKKDTIMSRPTDGVEVRAFAAA